jgi:hypothetical protein
VVEGCKGRKRIITLIKTRGDGDVMKRSLETKEPKEARTARNARK